MKSFTLLLKKEIKDIFSSKSSVLFLITLSIVTGYSFYSAVMLYSNASVSAINNPLYASGFEPVPGIFVPTWGGIFILFSLFLPFIIIPSVVLERERNTMVILLQIPFTVNEILLSKLVASILFVLFSLFLMVPAIIMWHVFGGNIAWGELILLNLGYFLYGIFVIVASMFSASLLKNTSSASILSILVITVSWVIDFGKDMNISPLVIIMSHWTTSRMLKFFEGGILSLPAVAYFVVISMALVFLSRSLLDVKLKIKWLVGAGVVMVGGMLLVSGLVWSADVTESHRNSFPPAISRALKKVPDLEIDVYLRRTDSRFRDYEQSFLKRLLLVKKDVKIRLMQGKALDKNYGLFVYRVNCKQATTYSNSEEEIFPIIFKLSGVRIHAKAVESSFTGYPLVVENGRQTVIGYVYYVGIPLIILLVVFFRSSLVRRGLEL